MSDRLPECVDEAVAEVTADLFARGVTVVRQEGFPPVLEVHFEGRMRQVAGIGEGKQAWVDGIYRQAAKLNNGVLPEIKAVAPPPAQPVESVTEVPPEVPADPVGVDGNGSPVVDELPPAAEEIPTPAEVPVVDTAPTE